jgi:hypothetical protein
MLKKTQLRTVEQDLLVWLKKHGYGRYVAVLFVPQPLRLPIACLYGIVVEMQHIPIKVTQPLLGALRFQWWQEQLSSSVTVDSTHPLMAACQMLRSHHPVVFTKLQSLIEVYHQEYLEGEGQQRAAALVAEITAEILQQPVTQTMRVLEQQWHASAVAACGAVHVYDLAGLPAPFLGLALLNRDAAPPLKWRQWGKLFWRHLF